MSKNSIVLTRLMENSSSINFNSQKYTDSLIDFVIYPFYSLLLLTNNHHHQLRLRRHTIHINTFLNKCLRQIHTKFSMVQMMPIMPINRMHHLLIVSIHHRLQNLKLHKTHIAIAIIKPGKFCSILLFLQFFFQN